jgi:hypothetical protein
VRWGLVGVSVAKLVRLLVHLPTVRFESRAVILWDSSLSKYCTV